MCSAALATLALASASVWAAKVYKWVDEKGVVHYSDQPHPEAQELDVQAAQSYRAPVPQSVGSSSNAVAGGSPYARCEVSRPDNDEVFFNTSTVSASVRLDPSLRGGDRIALSLDGKRLTNQPTSAANFTLTVERGTHTLTVTVEDSAGKAVCSSGAVTFHVRQPSVQAPNPANRPRF